MVVWAALPSGLVQGSFPPATITVFLTRRQHAATMASQEHCWDSTFLEVGCPSCFPTNNVRALKQLVINSNSNCTDVAVSCARGLYAIYCVSVWFVPAFRHGYAWRKVRQELLVQTAMFIKVSVNKIVLFCKYTFIVLTVIFPCCLRPIIQGVSTCSRCSKRSRSTRWMPLTLWHLSVFSYLSQHCWATFLVTLWSTWNKGESYLALGSITRNWGFRPPDLPFLLEDQGLSNTLLLGATRVSLPNGISFFQRF